MEPKQCCRCKNTYPTSCFNKNRTTKDGLCVECKSCRSERFTSPEYRQYRKQQYMRRKMDVMSHYSNGVPKCATCGIEDIRVLSIDHVEGGGNAHKKSTGVMTSGDKMYHWLRKNKYPPGFQVLCMNCQFIKRHENNECPCKL